MFQERYNRIVLPFNFLLDLTLLLTLYFLFLSQTNIFSFLLLAFLWVFPSLYFSSHHVPRTYSTVTALRPTLFCLGLFILLYMLSILLGILPQVEPSIQLFFIGSVVVFLPLAGLSRYLFFYRYRLKGKNIRYAALLGREFSTESHKKLNRNAIHLGYRFIGTLITQETYLQELQTLVSQKKLNVVFLKEESKSLTDAISAFCDDHGLRLKLLLSLSTATGRRAGLDQLGGFPIMDIRHEPLLYLGNRFLKRAMDMVMALLSIVFLLTWLPFVIKLAQVFFYPGPLFFSQKRVGRNGKTFILYKFRTMIHSSEAEFAKKGQAKKTLEVDARVPWFGRILRRTNLDEYPQFLNVFFGSMSTVGPRPHMVGEDVVLEKNVPRYRMRRFVKPGITGWAAINGYRGGTDDIELMTKRTEYDIWYLENWTVWLDIKIMAITIWQMLTFKIPKAY